MGHSKRRIRRRSCEKKIRHASKAAAIAHVRALRAKDGGHGVSIYRCAFCGQWHAGRLPKEARQAMAARRGR